MPAAGWGRPISARVCWPATIATRWARWRCDSMNSTPSAAILAGRQAGLLVNGGGHAMAAGLTVARSALPDLAKFLDERIAPQLGAAPAIRELGIDAAPAPAAATQQLVEMIERAGPFGA